MEDLEEKRYGVPVLESIIIVIVAYVASIYVTQVVYLILFPYEYALHFAMMSGELIIGTLPILFLIRNGISPSEYTRFRFNIESILIGSLLGVAMWLFNMNVVRIVYMLFGPSESIERTNKIVSLLIGTDFGLLLTTISMIITSISEEIAYRGLLYNALDRAYGSNVAILGSSIVFGLSHFDLTGVYIFVTFLLGLILSYTYSKKRNLGIVIIMHFLNNFLGVLVVKLFG